MGSDSGVRAPKPWFGFQLANRSEYSDHDLGKQTVKINWEENEQETIGGDYTN